MKIAIVSQAYYPTYGGVTEHVHYTSHFLRELGHKVKIVTGRMPANGGEEIEFPDVVRIGRSILIPSNGSFSNFTVGRKLSERLRDFLLSENFDLLHVHDPLAPTLPLFANMNATCPVVGTFHSSAKRSRGYQLFRHFLRKHHANLVGKIAVSEPARELIAKYFGGEYVIIPNGVDTNRFHPANEPLPEFLDGKVNLLFVGRLDPRKGLSNLIEAMPRIFRELGGNVRLIIVGGGYLRRILGQKVDGHIKPHVHFVGKISRELLPRFYATCDIFCSPATRNESFGIVLLEAMASGKPIIACDIPGYRTVVTDSREGLLVKPKDPGSLAEAIVNLARNGAERAAMGELGRKKALSYSWERITGRIESYYSEVLGRKRECTSRFAEPSVFTAAQT
ncbi:MAG: glycosyltransferase family 4 protein [Candidatus Eisenbacteria bacterium]|nr:glycosyltransferase family 4 protein [Candidatus Eisenbacteria bacterium]